jgi:hypothetical protein
MLPLLIALATCPAVPADTVPLIPKALIWMAQDTAVVSRDSASGIAYEFVNIGDSAVAIYKNCRYLATVHNSIGPEDTIPDSNQPPVWRGSGIRVVFVAPRFPEQLQKRVELIGVVRE